VSEALVTSVSHAASCSRDHVPRPPCRFGFATPGEQGIDEQADSSAGAFAVTFILVKTTMPVRLLIDAAITPKLAQKLEGTPLAGPLGLGKENTT
jgi:hypothetical protein